MSEKPTSSTSTITVFGRLAATAGDGLMKQQSKRRNVIFVFMYGCSRLVT
jgi:hypothetical protein